MITRFKLQWGRGFESTETRRQDGRQGGNHGFNGAVDLNPRKPQSDQVIHFAYIRFNGAVDLNPRKHCDVELAQYKLKKLQWGRGFESTETQDTTRTRSPGSSFNGAVDLNPRKPAPRCRGAFTASALQWGRGFESTETLGPRDRVRQRHQLQWGRGFESTETNSVTYYTCGLGPASMGPWI